MISVTTVKYTHCDVALLKVYSAISKGSAQIWRIIVASTRLLIISLQYAAMIIVTIPIVVDGMVRRLDSVVLKPRLRSESVKYC